MAEFINFADDQPQTVTFKYDQGLEKEDPKYKKTKFYWGVSVGSSDMMVSATGLLNDLLLFAGAKKGATATICKHTIPGDQKKFWTVEIDNIEYDSRNMSGPKEMATKPLQHGLKGRAKFLAQCYRTMQQELPDLRDEGLEKFSMTLFIDTPKDEKSVASPEAQDDLPF